MTVYIIAALTTAVLALVLLVLCGWQTVIVYLAATAALFLCLVTRNGLVAAADNPHHRTPVNVTTSWQGH